MTTLQLADGTKISIGDWIDDKVYATVTLGSIPRVRPRPNFGYRPGYNWPGRGVKDRWPDVLRVVHKSKVANFLERLRDGNLFLTATDARNIACALQLTDEARVIIQRLIEETDLTRADDDWAMTNLIDAAVELYSRGSQVPSAP